MQTLKANLDVIWKVGITLMLLGQYWVRVNFMTIPEFIREKEGALKQYNEDRNAVRAELRDINTTVKAINSTVVMFEVNSARIAEHSKLIRENETRVNNHEARIQVLEARRGGQAQPQRQEPK